MCYRFHTLKLINSHLRLVNGLASEKIRWAESVERMKKEELMLPGDVLLTSAYISYVGCFSRSYREVLLEEKWLPFFKSLNVRIFYNTPISIILILKIVIVFHSALHSSD